MSELVPPKQAAKLQNALLDYLTTTFALSDADAQRALDEFLRDPDEGIFKGPYLRTGCPSHRPQGTPPTNSSGCPKTSPRTDTRPEPSPASTPR
ncbi:helicase [Cutibacterium acnes JCM 18916]|nr:helicase [Cutibacterium acnes JCM 18916]